MIFEAHVVVYSRDAAADRAFRTDVLGLSGVDAGGGWLIFALPPAEMAVHPADHNDRHQLYFMCDDLAAQMRVQSAKGVPHADVQEGDWGGVAAIRLPGGGSIGLYQPKHPMAIARKRAAGQRPGRRRRRVRLTRRRGT